MWWEKKTEFPLPRPISVPPPNPIPERPVKDVMLKPNETLLHDTRQAVLGPSIVLKGDLTGDEDLLIAGQFEGTINLRDHSLTVGPHGQVKAEIEASKAVIHGAVTGNVSARERIEIRKTGHVMGDLVSPGIAIEEGAYFKGSIEILREGGREAAPALSPLGAQETSA